MERAEFDTLFNHLRTNFGTPVQIADEFWSLFSLVSSIGASRILEVGVENGGTLKFWDLLVGPGGEVVGVDESMARIALDLSPVSNLKLLEGDSHAPETIAKVKSSISEVDFLFIDGDHRYEGVKADFENFSPLVRKGGLIAFHDIHDGGVGPFWTEIKQKYNTTEFCEGIGIGVVLGGGH